MEDHFTRTCTERALKNFEDDWDGNPELCPDDDAFDAYLFDAGVNYVPQSHEEKVGDLNRMKRRLAEVKKQLKEASTHPGEYSKEELEMLQEERYDLENDISNQEEILKEEEDGEDSEED